MENKIDDGVIKFKFKLHKTVPLERDDYIELEKWRVILYKLSMIGHYQTENVGYGNLSIRGATPKNFVITGTQTGSLANLDGYGYTRVIDCSLKKNSLEAKGAIAPSSESLTHYSIYKANLNIKVIFHIHHKELWNFMIKNDELSTAEDTPYGTVQMAEEVAQKVHDLDRGMLVMKGHQDGIISFGATSEEAGQEILTMYKRFHSQTSS